MRGTKRLRDQEEWRRSSRWYRATSQGPKTWGRVMSGRPEGNDSGAGWIEPYDADAWHDFTPWRPGDQAAHEPTGGADAASGVGDDGRRWWTEPQPDEFGVGDRVR